MRRHPSLRPLGADPVPDRKVSDATFLDSPLPRHRFVGRVHPSLATSRANHPAYYQHQLHIVDNHDDTATDHNHGGHSPADDRSRSRGANVISTAGQSRSDAMPTGNRQSDSRVLGSVRPRDGGVGDRDRMARIELPTRRSEPHRLLLDLPDGTPTTQGDLRGGRVSRLVRGTVRCAGLDRSGRSPLLVCGTFALAIVIWTVILEAVL